MNFFFNKPLSFFTGATAPDSARASSAAEFKPTLLTLLKVGLCVMLALAMNSAIAAGANVCAEHSDASESLRNTVEAVEYVRFVLQVQGHTLLGALALVFALAAGYVSFFFDRAGLTGLLDATVLKFLSGGNGGLAIAETTANSLASSFDRDLDFFSSTDFEDLLVFTLDALELL